MLNCGVSHPTCYSRERAAAHMHGTAFPLARLKIILTIKNLYHIQCQSIVDELSKCQNKTNHAGLACIPGGTAVLESAAV